MKAIMKCVYAIDGANSGLDDITVSVDIGNDIVTFWHGGLGILVSAEELTKTLLEANRRHIEGEEESCDACKV